MQTMNILRDAKTFSKICHKDYLRFLYSLNMSKKQLRLMFKELFDLLLVSFSYQQLWEFWIPKGVCSFNFVLRFLCTEIN